MILFIYYFIGVFNLFFQNFNPKKPLTNSQKIFKLFLWPFDWTKKSKGSFQRYYKKTSLNRYMKEFKIK